MQTEQVAGFCLDEDLFDTGTQAPLGCHFWRKLDTVEQVLLKQERHGREAVVWATSFEEGRAFLQEKRPSQSGYPNVIARHNGLLALPANYACISEGIQMDDLRVLLLKRNRVLVHEGLFSVIELPEDLNFKRGPDFSFWVPRYSGSRHRRLAFRVNLDNWVEVSRVGAARPVSTCDHRSLEMLKRFLAEFYTETQHKICLRVQGKFPDLCTVNIQGVSRQREKFNGLFADLFSVLEDWHRVFGKRNFDYRKQEIWRVLLKQLGTQERLRRLAQYTAENTLTRLLEEMAVAQRRRLPEVTPSKQWPVQELLQQTALSHEERLNYKPKRPAKVGKDKHALVGVHAHNQPAPQRTAEPAAARQGNESAAARPAGG